MSEENNEVKAANESVPEIPADAAANDAVQAENAPEATKETEDVKEEVQAQEDAAAKAAKQAQEVQKVKDAAIDEMEKASQKALQAMREENNEESDEIVDEAEAKLDGIFADLREWLKNNTNPEKIKDELEKARSETARILNDTKEKVIEVAHSEQFKNTMAAGKDFLSGTGTMISDGLKYGYDKLMEVPEFKKVADRVDENVDKLRKSEILKDVVNNTEKGINDFNSAIFGGLRSFFSENEDKENAQDEKKED